MRAVEYIVRIEAVGLIVSSHFGCECRSRDESEGREVSSTYILSWNSTNRPWNSTHIVYIVSGIGMSCGLDDVNPWWTAMWGGSLSAASRKALVVHGTTPKRLRFAAC